MFVCVWLCVCVGGCVILKAFSSLICKRVQIKQPQHMASRGSSFTTPNRESEADKENAYLL